MCLIPRLHCTTTARHGTARIHHGLFGPRVHCGNQRHAHGVMNRHVSSRAYSRLFGGCYASYSYSDGSLFLLFPLALALQLFSELTEKEATTDVTTILTIQAEAVKEKGPVTHFSVCLSCIPFNSATSKCVDNTTSLRVSSSLHVAAIALLWEAFTNVSDTI